MKCIVIYFLLSTFVHASSLKDSTFQEWILSFKTKAIENGVNSGNLDIAFEGLMPNYEVLHLDQNQNATKPSFTGYIKKIFTLNRRISQGKLKISQYQEILNDISAKYQVPVQYIVSLWGIETRYGEEPSKYPVIQSLATLAWKSTRSGLFEKELILALKMIDQGYIKIENFKGSWAGATGQCQFMPSSFFTFSVPIGKTNIWTSVPDIFESIANYLKKSGWSPNEPWGHPVTLPDHVKPSQKGTNLEFQSLGVRKIGGGDLEFLDTKTSITKPLKTFGPTYLLYPNFKIILKWNNSEKFALSVGMLADGLAR